MREPKGEAIGQFPLVRLRPQQRLARDPEVEQCLVVPYSVDAIDKPLEGEFPKWRLIKESIERSRQLSDLPAIRRLEAIRPVRAGPTPTRTRISKRPCHPRCRVDQGRVGPTG